MPNVIDTLNLIKQGAYSQSIYKIYETDVKERISILVNAIKTFGSIYDDDREIFMFSSPGRAEICGNHTDHQGGCAITMTVDLDIIAIVSKNEEGNVRIQSEGYGSVEVAPNKLIALDFEEGTPTALVRGILYKFAERGFRIGGFDAYITSRIPEGSGLSSSAAFEIIVAKILSVLYNGNAVSGLEMAKAGQYAESDFYGKSCGLLDQLSIVNGGLNFIDFYHMVAPEVDPIIFDFNRISYSLYCVKCPGNHADLSDEYSSVAKEMSSVAKILGQEVLSKSTLSDLNANINSVREQCGDRALLRSLNYYDEIDRTHSVREALSAGDISAFKRLMIKSGEGSFKYLQNIYPTGECINQSAAFALFICEKLLRGRGAWRIHGGGFGGTILAFVPFDLKENFVETFERLFSKGSVIQLPERQFGVIHISQNKQEEI